ncbi:2,3-diaminopropionate biosynthesis protein SbnB [Nocardia macrotermitis]|uniref:Delta(1)-pyrroline-2-carboxylate reductase n=1 Tax=Nocardia macrotermitis TaxID=2585198 RepID=A0A7K0D3A6_9NOCA|nr:2,3-diaminopropionate biosynthesis protein SbnB [Nocardia macrotermitis]MQY20205.1 Delta(1)-pyrroline-2-carboxylate reductase [Nocardia macrotermitis]
MLILSSDQVNRLLADTERDVLEVVRAAYLAHSRSLTVVPHSSFLRFPESPADRIISLAAYLGDDDPIAGTKWIASYPGNITVGIPRASAAIILNSTRTGQPVAFLEASRISAWRTAASAALGASVLLAGGEASSVTLIGAGVINAEIFRFLRHTVPNLREVAIYDLDAGRACAFADRIASDHPDVAVRAATTFTEAVRGQPLLSFATTASSPYTDLGEARADAVVLHVSLRDLTPATIVSAVNIVDDTDHVCRAQTSLHLAEQATGGRDFITAEIGALFEDGAEVPSGGRKIFSPFGLGVLDIAVARFVADRAREHRVGVTVDAFLPAATT